MPNDRVRPRRARKTKRGEAGNGSGHFDPTDNVLDLVNAESQFQNHARESDALHQTAMRNAESRRVDEQAALRAEFADKLATAEAKRIDAIRAVDVNAVSVASLRASDQASVLATQVQQSAEALRALVATTATTVAQSLQQATTALSSRITTLEQAQYEGKGKQSYADPAFAELLSEVKLLRDLSRQGAGRDQGVRDDRTERRAGSASIIGFISLAVGSLVAVLALLGYIAAHMVGPAPAPIVVQAAPPVSIGAAPR